MALIPPSGQAAYSVSPRALFTKYDQVGALCQQLGIFASQGEYLLTLRFHIDTLTATLYTYYLQWREEPPVDDTELEERARELLQLIVFGRSLQLQWYAVHPDIRIAWIDGWVSVTQLSRWITGLTQNTDISGRD